MSTLVLVGYARVSTEDQNPDAQRGALARAGVAAEQIYTDRTSGAKSSRPAWDALQRSLREGDVLVATRLDRVGRSTTHLVSLLDELGNRGVAFRFLEQGIDTTTSEGRLMYRLLAAIAEFQRDLITSNTREGLAAARVRGRRGGRKPKLTAEQARLAQQLYDAGEQTVAQIGALFHVPRGTLYGYLDQQTVGSRPRAGTQNSGDHLGDQDLAGHAGAAHEALRALACPDCGREPASPRERWQQRQDLATVWLHLTNNTVEEHRHCTGCQPHTEVLVIECALCGDGPLVLGTPPAAGLDQWPAALHRWLREQHWSTDPELICGQHHRG